ncbi:MAG: type II secretion system F family protein [Candidatus Caenarcaniphilales bacterium]|nr:type II secretion system F family protein [Candidatus Caenarcaniphilales bacterium]
MDWNIIIIAAIIAVLAIIGFTLYQRLIQKEYVEERLRETFVARSRELDSNFAANTNPEEADYQTAVMEFIDSKLKDQFPILGERIKKAGYKINTATWIAVVTLIAIIASGVLIWLLKGTLGGGAFVFAATVFIVVYIIAYAVIGFHIEKRVNDFDEQFGVGLDVMSASMRSGGTFMSSLKSVAAGSDPPLGMEMGILATELGLGTDMPTALDRFKERVPSKNLLIFVIAIKVANQTGSSLAPILSTLSHVITERFRLQGLINIGIAENLMGIVILASFPWIIIPILAYAWPEAYEKFFKEILGQLIGLGTFIWYCFGIYMMYKTVKSIDT